MAMDIKLERALIRTYRKLREKPTLTNAEIAGLFVNFYYAETSTHGGLDTRGFTIVRKDNIVCIALSSRSSYFEQSASLYDELLDLKPSDFYALYLRASFEDPNNESYGDPALKCVLNVQEYLKYKV
jgi:hypothetical protein